MKMNETEKNLEKNPEENMEEMEQVNGGNINDIVRDYNNREQMKKDFIEGERMRLREMLNKYKQ